jgi:hypothetical protein
MAGALRFSSTAVMPNKLREMVEAQGKGAPRETHRTAPALPKPNKYHNHPTTVDGIRFDSKREARYYEQLKIRKAMGEVAYFLRQVPIHLPGGTKLVIDFQVFYTDPARNPDYIDAKGKQTKEFRIKKREVEHHYPFEIKCV